MGEKDDREELAIPSGATKLNADVYLSSSGKQLVVLGDPDVLGLPEEWHSCDYMGCCQEHVIARPSVTGDDWRDEDMQLILSLLDELLGRCIVLRDDGNNDADNEAHSLVQGLLLGTADLSHVRDRLKELRGE